MFGSLFEVMFLDMFDISALLKNPSQGVDSPFILTILWASRFEVLQSCHSRPSTDNACCLQKKNHTEISTKTIHVDFKKNNRKPSKI